MTSWIISRGDGVSRRWWGIGNLPLTPDPSPTQARLRGGGSVGIGTVFDPHPQPLSRGAVEGRLASGESGLAEADSERRNGGETGNGRQEWRCYELDEAESWSSR